MYDSEWDSHPKNSEDSFLFLFFFAVLNMTKFLCVVSFVSPKGEWEIHFLLTGKNPEWNQVKLQRNTFWMDWRKEVPKSGCSKISAAYTESKQSVTVAKLLIGHSSVKFILTTLALTIKGFCGRTKNGQCYQMYHSSVLADYTGLA